LEINQLFNCGEKKLFTGSLQAQDFNLSFMVEVFKTNVRSTREAKRIIQKLAEAFPAHKINFDLSDCDRILRVQGNNVLERKIISIVTSLNYNCEMLE
jgi:hypothetical protein